MKTNTFGTVTLALGLSALVGAAFAADVTGKWQSEFESPIGQLKYTYDLKAEGEKVSGKAIRELDGQKTEIVLKDGKVSGDEVSFVEPLEFDGQTIPIEYKGKATGDEMSLSRKVGDFATMQIVAKREKTAAQLLDGEWQAEFDTQIGKQKYVFTLKSDGSAVTGKANAEIGGEKFQTELKEGKLSGNQVSFVEPLVFQGTELRLAYKGTLAGDELKLTREVGDVATEELVAKRVNKPVKAPASTPSAASSTPARSGAGLQLVKVSSEETAGENGKGSNALDGDPTTNWHTEWQENTPSHPHEIIIKLPAAARIKGFTYLPRQDESENGTIKDYEFYVSNDANAFGQPAAKGTFAGSKDQKTISFEAKQGQFVKLKALSEINDGTWASAAEIGIMTE